MFNQYLALTPENADIAMVNVVLEDLKFIVISLDQIFRGHAGEDYYNEEHTFYFYHLQNALTSWGAVINMLSSGLKRQKNHNDRARHLREVFDIDSSAYKWLFNKSFRNARRTCGRAVRPVWRLRRGLQCAQRKNSEMGKRRDPYPAPYSDAGYQKLDLCDL